MLKLPYQGAGNITEYFQFVFEDYFCNVIGQVPNVYFGGHDGFHLLAFRICRLFSNKNFQRVHSSNMRKMNNLRTTSLCDVYIIKVDGATNQSWIG